MAGERGRTMDILEFRQRVSARLTEAGVTEDMIRQVLTGIASDAIDYAGAFAQDVLQVGPKVR